MSFDKSTRNLLSKIVAACRDRLAQDITEQLQSFYGLHPDGTKLDIAQTRDARRAAGDLRALLAHFELSAAGSSRTRQTAAYQRLVREIGFTTLNRLAALRLCEERKLVIECVRQGMDSDGFQMFDNLTHGALGSRYETYRTFLYGLFDELALDLGVLYDRRTPQSAIFPQEAALTEVLTLLNNPKLAAARVWQQDETIGWIYQYYNDPVERKAMRKASNAPRNSRELAVRNQFFTPRYVVEFLTDNTLGRTWYEMRRGKTRLVSQCHYLVRRPCDVFLQPLKSTRVPDWLVQAAQGDFSALPESATWKELQLLGRLVNGYELAPELGLGDCDAFAGVQREAYHKNGVWQGSSVELWICLFAEQQVQDAPKGREWQDISALYTALCTALRAEQETSDQEKLLQQPVYIAPRPLKDPRDIKILDPAGGSGHFLLYAFDLLTTIYEEAWADPASPPFSETHTPLAADYADLDTLRRVVPGLILRHNLHGIDIDPRAVQIAALAMWLRAQRAYQELKLDAAQRPRITKTNIVVAEPMPGDSQMRQEFLRGLRPPVLAGLVQKVFEKMELAGEAGSLLKIESELTEAIAEAKGVWTRGPQMEQLSFSGMEPPPKEEQLAFDLSGVTDAQFWETAERRVLDELQKYARRAVNGQGTRRRLFVEDAAQGFAFVDLCRKKFDVVLMNPPFGSPSKVSRHYLQRNYVRYYQDSYSSFIVRAQRLLSDKGLVGALTSRTFMNLSKFESTREIVTYNLLVLIDLGTGILDSATVSTSAFVLNKMTNIPLFNTPMIFLKLDDLSADKKAIMLRSVISLLPINNRTFLIPRSFFEQLPNKTMNYLLSEGVYRVFNNSTPLSLFLKPTVGLQTGNDFRFIRSWVEISKPFHKSGWPLAPTGGKPSRFYRDLTDVVNWQNAAREMKAFYLELAKTHKSPPGNGPLRDFPYYFVPGFTYTYTSSTYFSCHPLPTGSIVTTASQGLFFNTDIVGEHFYYWLGVMNSWITLCMLRLINPGRFFQAGYVSKVPVISHSVSERSTIIASNAKKAASTKFWYCQHDEVSRYFRVPWALTVDSKKDIECAVKNLIEMYNIKYEKYQSSIDEALQQDFCLNDKDILRLEKIIGYRTPTSLWFDEASNPPHKRVWKDCLSYCVGLVYGRWDTRTKNNSSPTNLEATYFLTELEGFPPAILIAPNGLPATSGNIVSEAWLHARPNAITLPPEGSFSGPATIPDTAYPIQIAWDGILVDDAGIDGHTPHPCDIVERVREVLTVLWPENHTAIEAEAAEILGVRELGDYFRKPSGFFANHLKRYSKSRRKAPIYWPLSSSSGKYTLWLYYHRLTDQTLYTAVNRYVSPKIEQLEGRVTRLENEMQQAGGRAATLLRDQLDKSRTFLTELRVFRDDLLDVAGLPYKPNLNDGVIINAAPLHRFFKLRRWAKDTAAMWKKLEDGAYDWAHLAYTLWPERVREVCKTDRSVAIAHGLEALCTVKEIKKSRKKKAAKPNKPKLL